MSKWPQMRKNEESNLIFHHALWEIKIIVQKKKKNKLEEVAALYKLKQ